MTPTLTHILRDHTSLSIHCVDRLYINGYLPSLQTSGQLWYFLHKQLGFPLASPAILKQIHQRFVGRVNSFVNNENVPLVPFFSSTTTTSTSRTPSCSNRSPIASARSLSRIPLTDGHGGCRGH